MNPSRILPWLDGTAPPAALPPRLLLSLLGGIGWLHGAWQWGRSRMIQGWHPPCPVISVGNLTTGGTGKTPLVLWLARHIQPTGLRIAIVSRGYRQRSKAPVTVIADPDAVRLTPPAAADEAVLLARALPGVTLLTGPHRPTLIRHAVERFQCEIVLMDDGFQRLDVHKDLDLVLLDARHPFGNGRLLPGGLLREFPSALARCHAILLTRADDPQATSATLRLLASRFPDKPLLTAIHRPTGWIPLHAPATPLPLDLPSQSWFAFCAIAAPERFRATLHSLPVSLCGFRPFPDHHAFTPRDLDRLQAEARAAGAQGLLCTEKDAVKLDPARLALPTLALRVAWDFREPPDWLTARLATLTSTTRQPAGKSDI